MAIDGHVDSALTSPLSPDPSAIVTMTHRVFWSLAVLALFLCAATALAAQQSSQGAQNVVTSSSQLYVAILPSNAVFRCLRRC